MACISLKFSISIMPHVTQQPRRNRQRNIILFNPPFSKNVKTNICMQFPQLVVLQQATSYTKFSIGTHLRLVTVALVTLSLSSRAATHALLGKASHYKDFRREL